MESSSSSSSFFCRLSSDTETYFSRNVIWSTFFPSFLALRLRLMVLGNRHGQTDGRRSFGRCWLLLSFGARQSACKWSKPHRQRRPYRLLCTSRTLELVVAMLDGWQDKCGVCRCYAWTRLKRERCASRLKTNKKLNGQLKVVSTFGDC